MTDQVTGHEIVIYFKFHENQLRSRGTVGVENRPLPLTWPMAYTTALFLIVSLPCVPTSILYADQRTISCVSWDLSCARCRPTPTGTVPSVCFVSLGLL